MKRRSGIILLSFAVATGTLWAQDDEVADRGVARISGMSGEVSVKRGDSGDWMAAVLNGPLVVGDSVNAGDSSRAEIQFDQANFARLGQGTEAKMAELDTDRYVVELSRGTLLFSVIRDSAAQAEISLPSVSLRPLENGLYRVDVFEDGTAQITVRDGSAEIFSPKGSQTLSAGNTMIVRGTVDDPEFRVVQAVAADDLEQWARSRDNEFMTAQSNEYVGDTVSGAADLDPYGDWVSIAPYGYCWEPRVAVGWAPYREGRWTWLDWYGWTWVSYDPWGWAPYHYGRWFSNANRWYWWPGDRATRHSWSPALVGWIGYGGGDWSFGAGLGFGRIGWVPLAPYEPYHRWYGSGFYGGYAGHEGGRGRVNIVGNVNVGNVYRNARFDNSITGIDSRDFRDGRFGHLQGVQRGEVDRASLMRGALPMTPDRATMRFSDREARGVVSGSRANGHFFSSRPVSRVDRVPVDQQRTAIQDWSRRAAGQSPSRADQAGQVGTRGEASRAASPGTGSPHDAEGSASRQSGRSAHIYNAEPERANTNAASTSTGWRKIGEVPPAAQTGAAPGDSAASPASRGAAGSSGQSGWRGAAQPAGGERSNDSGWVRFGDPRGGASPAVEKFSQRDPAPPNGGATRGATPAASQGRTAGGNGWGRFGDPSRGATPGGSRSTPAPASIERGKVGGGIRGSSGGSRPSIGGGGQTNSGGHAASGGQRSSGGRSGGGGRKR